MKDRATIIKTKQAFKTLKSKVFISDSQQMYLTLIWNLICIILYTFLVSDSEKKTILCFLDFHSFWCWLISGLSGAYVHVICDIVLC